MKTVEIPPEATAITQLLHQAREEDLLVRDSEGREFILFAIDDFDQELICTRKNEKLMAFLDERGQQSQTKDERPIQVGQIVIIGNDRTVDWLIRQAVPLSPGTPLLEPNVRQGERNLGQLGLFEKVKLSVLEGESEYKDILVEVVERPDNQWQILHYDFYPFLPMVFTACSWTSPCGKRASLLFEMGHSFGIRFDYDGGNLKRSWRGAMLSGNDL